MDRSLASQNSTALAVVGSELRQYEANIDDGLKQARSGFMQIAQSVETVRALELWKNGPYESFEDWGSERYGWGKRRLYQWAQADQVLQTLRSAGNPALPMPANENQANPLARLRNEPERLVEAWGIAVERAGVTAPGRPIEVPGRIVSEVVKELKPPKPRKKAVAKPESLERLAISLLSQMEKALDRFDGDDRDALIRAIAAVTQLTDRVEDIAGRASDLCDDTLMKKAQI